MVGIFLKNHLSKLLLLSIILFSIVSVSHAAPIISVNEIGSNNAVNPSTYAREGDTVFLNFSSSEELNITDLDIIIENSSVGFDSADNITFYAQYNVPSDLKFKQLEYEILNIQNLTENKRHQLN